MNSSNKVLGIIVAVILVGTLSGVIYSIVDDNRELEYEYTEPVLTDDTGDFNPQQLFEQSNETLEYAGHIDITGSVLGFKMYSTGFETRKAEIRYSRDYTDRDNYLSNLNVDISNLTNDGTEGVNWRYIYRCSEGKIDTRDFRKFDKDGSCGSEGITNPDIETILFPDVSNCNLSFESKNKSNGMHPDTVAYQVVVTGDISHIVKAAKSLVGNVIEPTRAVYVFDSETHVLKEIYLLSDDSSLMKHNGKNGPLFSMKLIVDDYDYAAQKSVMISLSDNSEDLLDEITANKKMVVLDEKLMQCGKTTTYDNIHGDWYRYSDLIWDDLFGDGNTKHCIRDFWKKAREAGEKYGYNTVNLSYGYTGIVDGSRNLLIKLDFYGDNSGGSIIIPQSVLNGKVVGGRPLSTLGYGDSFDMNMDKFVDTRKHGDKGESKVYGHFEGVYGFRFDMYEATMYSIADLQQDTAREHFSFDKDEYIRNFAYRYPKADGIGLKYVSLANRDVDNFYSVESFYLPVITDPENVNRDYISLYGKTNFPSDCGLHFKDEERLMDCYKEIGIENGSLENNIMWIEFE